MAFSDHKIAAFAHKITDLPDQPNLPADELKARFDSSPEEFRVAHNALCDDAGALESRVDGIVEGSFAGAVTEALLAPELAAKLNGAATTAAVTAQVSAETTARESADDALDARVDALETSVPQKCEVAVGSYAGNGTYPRTIELGYHPRCVFIATPNGPVATESESYSMLIVDTTDTGLCGMTDTGFLLKNHAKSRLNESGTNYFYMVIR